tara:strand:- start:5215 stop:5664 length:450 start_codon:yes stop_codon:yes gene_type:complete
MLKAKREWEVEDVTNKIFGDDGCRTFPFIEVSMNCMLYLVDIEVEGEDDWRLTRRFICTTMNEVTQLIRVHEVLDHKLALLSRRCDNESDIYSVDDVVRIVVAEDKNECRGGIIECENGKKYFDHIREEDGPFKTVNVLYDRKAETATS